MKTTTEGFLMNTLRRISRHMAKAVAAGAVLVAAALPIAVATEASAAAIPTASYLQLTQVSGVPANNGGPGLTPIFAQGWSGAGTFVLTVADAANLNGSGAAAVTTTAAGVTFSGGLESVNTATQVAVNISAGAAVPAGYYPATITDGAGTVTIANAFYVDAAPTVTAVTPATVAEGNTAIPVTLTGTGFAAGMTAVFGPGAVGGPLVSSAVTVTSPTSATATVTTTTASAQLYAVKVSNLDGGVTTSTVGVTVTGPTITSIAPASLAIPATATTTPVIITGTGFEAGAVVALAGTTAAVGVVTYTSSTSLTAQITVPSSASVARANVTVTNPDLSHATATGGLGIGEASLAPAVVTAVTPNLTLGVGSIASLTITGTGFGAGQGATVQFLSTAGTSDTAIACATTNVTSDTSIICTLSPIGSAVISGPHSVQVTASTAAGAPVSNALANALTITGPVITAVSPAAIPANFNGTLTLTGTGFSSTGLSAVVSGNGGGTTTAVATFVSATSVTILLSGSTIGAANSPALVLLTDNAQFAAFSVPVVIAPSITGVVYPGTTTGVGQGASAHSIVINGTGFLPALTVTFPTASGITALVTSVSPTSLVASVTVPGTTAAASYAITVTNTNGGSFTSITAPTSLTVDLAPGVLTLSPSTIKAGAAATAVTISGAGITATSGAVVTTNSTLITLGTVTPGAGHLTVPVTVAPVTGTVPVIVAVTVTNADGGSSTTTPANNLIVNPGITIIGTYFVPTFSTNFEVVVHGTGFAPGMTVTSSNAAYTVAIANISADGTAVTLLVSTTSAATSGTSSTLVFTNLDGNTVTFLLNGGPAAVPVTFHVTKCVGHAVAGKTVTMSIVGTGFYGQPKITGAAGTRAVVSHDNGKVLTVRVTVARGTPNGGHSFTVRLANGKAAGVRYNQHA
jgi:hypothetical protein